jgi:MFS family permease
MKDNERSRGRGIERAALATGAAIAALHFANGATEPSFTPHWPQLQHDMGLDDGRLGVVLACLPFGLLLGGAAAGRVLGRISAKTLIVVGGLLFWGGLPVVGLAESALWWAGALLVIGFGNGALDVAWQLESTRFERGRKRRYHVLMQALFSGGSVVGAAVAGVALAGHVAPVTHLGLFAVAAMALAGVAVLGLPRAEATAAEEAKLHEGLDGGRSPLRSPRLWLLAVVVLASMLPLGTVYVWSTPYLQRMGATGGAAALGLTAFAVAQVVGQITVGLLPRERRLGDPRLLSALGAGIALVGAVLVVATGSVAVAVAGFAVLGLGMSPFPSLPQSVAAERFHHHPQAASLLTVAGYGGVFAAPTLFGLLSGAFGLRFALALLVPLAAGIGLVMPSVLREGARRRRRPRRA